LRPVGALSAFAADVLRLISRRLTARNRLLPPLSCRNSLQWIAPVVRAESRPIAKSLKLNIFPPFTPCWHETCLLLARAAGILPLLSRVPPF
jgi:hypothetical protein